MPQDKQLRSIKLKDVLEKRRLDQALNAKEFAVAAGISYHIRRRGSGSGYQAFLYFVA